MIQVFIFDYYLPVYFYFSQCRMSNANTELRLAQKDSRSVCMKLAEKELQLSTTEGDLRVEREWRITLQETTLKDKSKISDLMQKLLEEKSRNRVQFQIKICINT